MNQAVPTRTIVVTVNVTEDGRVIIPATAMAELGIEARGPISAAVVDGEVVLDSLGAAVRRAQAEVRRHVPEGVLLSEELIAERRAEAERE